MRGVSVALSLCSFTFHHKKICSLTFDVFADRHFMFVQTAGRMLGSARVRQYRYFVHYSYGESIFTAADASEAAIIGSLPSGDPTGDLSAAGDPHLPFVPLISHPKLTALAQQRWYLPTVVVA